MNLYHPNTYQESYVISDSHSSYLTSDIDATQTNIYINATNMGNFAESGVVWIGSERITYGAKTSTGELKFCTRGTLGTPQQAHLTNAVVQDANQQIPILEHFAHYGDDLQLAYNDSGVSLGDPGFTGNSREHAFIRNAGEGSI
jgi:hypothetical protein